MKQQSESLKDGTLKSLVHDPILKVTAWRFCGLSQPFPDHLHPYYVIGLVEKGYRTLSFKGVTLHLGPGDLLLLQPGDAHGCTQVGKERLDYRSLNLSRSAMADYVTEITGSAEIAGDSEVTGNSEIAGAALPGFTTCIAQDPELSCLFRSLHDSIMAKDPDADSMIREENMLLFLSLLLKRYSQPFPDPPAAYQAEIEAAMDYMLSHLASRISLEGISRWVGLSQSTLLRAFTRTMGMTPYRYLETLRVSQAKKLLEQGAAPTEAALACGFSDQSHFTNYFNRFIGITPGAYRDMFLPEVTKGDHHEP